MDTNPETANEVHCVKRAYVRKPVIEGADVPDVEPVQEDEILILATGSAQSYALRVWAGQSDDVSLTDRVARVVAALKGQGLSLDVTLPHKDAARLLAKHQ